jgi:hypothetical protein
MKSERGFEGGARIQKVRMILRQYSTSLIVLFGLTLSGAIITVIIAFLMIFFNYKRLFTVDIKNLNKKKTYVVECILGTISLVFYLFTNEGSILYVKNAQSGDTVMTFNLLFILFGVLLYGIPTNISWKKIINDPMIKETMKKMKNRERLDI